MAAGRDEWLVVVERGAEINLSQEPDRLRLIATIEIPVKDALGTYLLVVYPDYSGAESIDNDYLEAGEWTPPYVSYNVEEMTRNLFPKRLSTHTGELLKRFDRASEQVDLREALYSHAERLGLSAMDLKPNGEVCYYRRAFRKPENFRGYCIKKYIGRISKGDFPNVADPEMRKGFAFLPIDDDFSLTSRRYCERHERHERLFLGKPIAVNLAADLEHEAMRETLCNRATEIPKPMFTSKQKGFIFAGDLAGYGAFCEFLKSNTGNLDMSGDAVAESLRDSATHEFTRMFRRSGIYQTHMSGDGFICVVSASEYEADPTRLREFLRCYSELTCRLDEFNAKLAELPVASQQEDLPMLGSRLAIHFGEYRFGKMSMFASLSPSFDGAAIIEAARIEGGLRNQIASDDKPAGHWVAISKAARTRLSDIEDLLPVELVERVTVSDKEFQGDAEVWRVSRESGLEPAQAQ